MSNNKRELDITLNILIIINLINAIAMLIGGSTLKIKYITLILNLLCITFCKKDKMLPVIFYLHCNSALYDDIGFKYLFNFSIVICTFKLIVCYKQSLNKRNSCLFMMLFLWEILLIFKANDINNGWISLISWVSSYLILILYSSNRDDINFSKIYKYFSIGFVMAFVCGIAVTINRWGINIPTAYRFTGLLRDPNYYCMDAILLIFSTPSYAKLNNKKTIFYTVLFFVLGIVSVSKTFILLFIFGCLLKIITNIDKIKISIYKIIMFITVGSVMIMIIIKTNGIGLIMDKYLYRMDTTTLFTGRDYIQTYYLNELFSNPYNILFGNSVSKYSYVMGIGQERGREFFLAKTAHNTYLDILLSWGMLGTGLYILFLYSVFIKIKEQYDDYKQIYNKDFLIIGILFAIGMFVLSYLAADVFAIFILYLLILKYCLYEKVE